MQGHGTRELWGLASHPRKDEFVTVGDDGTLRVWDAKNFAQVKTVQIDAAARAVIYSPDGNLIAVGFGNGVRMRGKATKDGAFIVLTSHDYKIVHEGKDSNEPIRVVKFSPDGKLLAVGSEDSMIIIYNVKDHYSRRSSITCHKSPVLNFDFSSDGQFLQSVDSTSRICYSETASGVNIPSPASLRDEKWMTCSCPVGWPVQGLWKSQPQGVKPLSVNKVTNTVLTQY